MLQRRTAANGVVYYASPLLERAGVPHAFSTRIGGVSPPPFDALNFGSPGAVTDGAPPPRDDPARIALHRRLLQEAAGCAGRELCGVHQVHGPAVLTLRRGDPSPDGRRADAIVTDDPARVASVRTADCVPVLIAAPGGRAVAAAHAGWRGIIAGIVPAAVEALLRVMRECRPSSGGAGGPSSLLAAIGPSIGPDAFEVGPEVIDAFTSCFGERAPLRSGEGREGRKGLVDLRQAVRLQLVDAGLTHERIDGTDRCTSRDRDEFFSHRRDRGLTGRMMSVIAPRPTHPA